jgi:hypothetical protein
VYTNNFVNDQQQAQRELFDLQQRVEAWNIIIPFLQHDVRLLDHEHECLALGC